MCPPGAPDSPQPTPAPAAPSDPSDSSVPPPAAPVVPPPGPGVVLLLVVALLVGVGLRVGLAYRLPAPVSEWEADGFVTAWLGRPWSALNRERPPGSGWLVAALARQLPTASVLAVRWLGVGLSLLGLWCAFACAASVAAVSGVRRPSALRACAWMSLLWAVHPTLLMGSVSPTPGVVLGGLACLLLASLALLRSKPGLLALGLTTLCASAFVCTAGIGGAVALAVGVVVYVLPVPGLLRCLTALVLLGCVFAAGWWVQRGPDPGRPWLPDTTWARSFSALVRQVPPHPNDIPSHADLRARQTLALAQQALRETPPLEIATATLQRLGFELLGPRRFEPLLDAVVAGSQDTPADSTRRSLLLGLDYFDLFVRGGLLLFLCAVIGMLARPSKGYWPRAACVVAGVAWLLVLVLGACDPFALAPLDLVLLALAGAGVAGTNPQRIWTRRLSFGLGGLLLCSLLASAGLGDRPLSSWLTTLDQPGQEGRLIVALLADGGPTTAEDQLRAAELLARHTAPLQRLPEPALAFADAALVELVNGPNADAAVEMLVRTQVENLLYADAAELAENYHVSRGRDPDKRSMMLLEWVQNEQRAAENLPQRKP